jgi:hypothetical protein
VASAAELDSQENRRGERHRVLSHPQVKWRRGDFVGVAFTLDDQVAKLVQENRRKHSILKG